MSIHSFVCPSVHPPIPPRALSGPKSALSGLKSTLSCLISTLSDLESEMANFRSEKTGLGGQISGLRGQIQGLRGQIQGLRGQIQGLRGQIQGLRGQISCLRGLISGLRGKISGLSRPGGTNAWTDKQINGQPKVPLCSTGLCPLWCCCPKRQHFFSIKYGEEENGQFLLYCVEGKGKVFTQILTLQLKL